MRRKASACALGASRSGASLSSVGWLCSIFLRTCSNSSLRSGGGQLRPGGDEIRQLGVDFDGAGYERWIEDREQPQAEQQTQQAQIQGNGHDGPELQSQRDLCRPDLEFQLNKMQDEGCEQHGGAERPESPCTARGDDQQGDWQIDGQHESKDDERRGHNVVVGEPLRKSAGHGADCRVREDV